MWNRLVTPLIGNREVMKGRGEGTSAKEETLWKEWLSTSAIGVDGGVAIGL